MDNNSFKIYIKPELFDHLIYPISVKLDDEKIISLFRKLHILSEIDFKIPMKEWLKNAMEIGLTKVEATVLFQTFKIYEGDQPESQPSTKNRYESSTNNKNSVDVRYFGLFFALQSFSQRTKISLILDKTEKNPNYFTSPLSSPRGKSSNNYRLANQGMEYQFILNYIKSNLKLFLRIVASDIHNTETTINANEFNTLKFLFTIEDNNHNSLHDKNKKNYSLSNHLHCFDNLPPVTKINMNIINEFLSSALSTSAPELSNYATIKGLSKCVTIKTGNEYQNKNLLISNCDDTYIYINTNVSNCKISLCTNCTIVIAVASKIISIDKCEKCNICIITNFTRISNMIDSNVYLFSVYEPILYGDNRGLKLGPHNVTYNDLYLHVKESRLTISQNSYKNFSLPIYLNNNNKEHVYIIKPEEFTTIVVPFDVKDPFNYILTPKPYLEVVQKRYSNYNNIQKMIKEAGFQESQEKAFHIALQGFFREWLVTSGNFKPMNDLVKMIDEPYGIGPLNSK
jgi:TBCC domain-containing protein 1